MPKRSRIVVFVMLPVAVFLWFVGWSFYWIGGKKEEAKPKKIAEANDLTFTVLFPEDRLSSTIAE